MNSALIGNPVRGRHDESPSRRRASSPRVRSLATRSRSRRRSTMNRLYATPDDFEATIRILSTAEGGRATPAFNGIRWDLAYAEDDLSEGIWMIWPDFVDESHDSLPTDRPLPVGVDLPARMTVVSDAVRAQVHRQKIKIGTRFYCHEGAKRVAAGHVTRITGLFDERPKT